MASSMKKAREKNTKQMEVARGRDAMSGVDNDNYPEILLRIEYVAA